MTDVDREKRLSIAMAELDEFCGIFGFSWEWAYAGGTKTCASTALEIKYPRGAKNFVVLRECARRDYRGTGYSPLYSIAERLLSRIKRGVTLAWQWEESRPAERGRLTVRYTRKYRVPGFASVAALKIMLAAEGSEFTP